MGSGYTKAVGSIIMAIFAIMSYGPLALQIEDYATNATTTNAIWVLLDTTFGLFWSMFIIAWITLAIWFLLDEIR